MSKERVDSDFWFDQHRDVAATEQKTPPIKEPARLSPVVQLQRSMGNARLLQLRSRMAAVQAHGMSMADATAHAEQHATESFEAQRQAQAEDPGVVIPSGGQALPSSVQKTAEQHLGVSLGDVQVISNADSATKPIQAQAFATEDAGVPKVVLGNDVDLNSKDGQFTLAHELAHVAQTKKGANAGLTGLGGDEGLRNHLENDADHHGAALAKKMGT